MKYVGNFVDWIKQEYIDYMLANDGTPRPAGGRNPDSEEFKKAKEHGYDLGQVYWYIFESDTFPFDIQKPFNDGHEYLWWGIKMNPGNFMPIHRDPHTYDPSLYEVKRYWMSLQDWEPGHIFMYEDQVLVNYKKGDIYCYPDPQAIHCACNIGNTPRLTFHFSTYIKKTF
jgi:hypothetical protein